MSEIERLAHILDPDAFDIEGSNDDTSSRLHNRGRAKRTIRAILTAMREPSEGMKDAGFDALMAAFEPRTVTARDLQLASPEVSWQAMIDHILNEPE